MWIDTRMCEVHHMPQCVLKGNTYHCPRCLGIRSPYMNKRFEPGSWVRKLRKLGGVRAYIPDSYLPTVHAQTSVRGR